MTSSKSLVKNSTIYAIGEICPRLFSLIVFPILTSHLSAEEYGIINYVNTIDVFLSVFSLLGLNTFFLVYYYKMPSEQERKNLMGTLSLFIVANTMLISTLLFIYGSKLFSLWGSNVDFYPYIAIGVLTNLFNAVTVMPVCYYRVIEKPLPLTLLNVLKSFVIMIGTIVLIKYYGGSSKEVLEVRLCVSALFAGIFIYLCRNHFTLTLNLKTVKQGLKFSLPLLPGSISYYLFSMSDRLLIDKYLSLRDLGLYSTASTLAMLLNIISNGAYKAFEPYFFQIYGQPQFNDAFRKVRDTLLFVVIVFGTALSLFSKECLWLLSSEEFHSAYIYVPILTIGTICSAMSLMYSTIIIAKGKTIINTIITIIGALVSIVLNIILLPKIGIYSAAIVFSLSFVIIMVLNAIASKINIPILRPVVALVLSFILIFISDYLLKNAAMSVSLFAKIIIYIFIIIVVSKVLGFKMNSLVSILKK